MVFTQMKKKRRRSHGLFGGRVKFCFWIASVNFQVEMYIRYVSGVQDRTRCIS